MENHQIQEFLKIEDVNYKNPYDSSKVHRHSYFEMILFDASSGEGTDMIDFEEYKIEKRSLHIIYPNQIHLMKKTVIDHGLVMQFNKDFLLESIPNFNPEWLFSLQSNPASLLSKEQFSLLHSSFLHLDTLLTKKRNFQMELIKNYFSYLIFQILEILKANKNDLTQKNHSLLFLNLAENQFKENRNIASYAEQMNISTKKLNTEVKERLGKTPLQVLHHLLLMEIKRLLFTTHLTQKEISYLLSFDSPTSYTRFVKKHFKISPKQLKERLHSE